MEKPIVLITGAAGNIGRSLARALETDYRIVGLDQAGASADFPLFEVDITDPRSVAEALDAFRGAFGPRIASVIHLVAYFDFTGEDNPLYRKVNVDGTRHLLRALQDFEVEQFVYAGTMLVHAPTSPGRPIDESQPVDPRWAYPQSKAAAEAVIREEHGAIPYVLLHLAGLYDEKTSVPTLANQVARIYERDLQSYLYSGSTLTGQAMIHRDDLVDAFRRTVDRRTSLPGDAVILIGEERAIGYDALQDELGYLFHGSADWPTIRIPKPLAAAGAWAQEKLEPVVPDAIDQGEPPFIRPFMVRMADDHYELDIRRAREWLGWEPRHRLKHALPAMVEALRDDPKGWYEANGLTPPPFVLEADEIGRDPEALRSDAEARYRAEHAENRWTHFVNVALGCWLLFQPPLVGVSEPLLAWSEAVLGAGVMLFATLSLSWRLAWARWVCAALGTLVMAAPFLFWTSNGAAYLSDTLVGALIFGFAVGAKPESGPSIVARSSGPVVPPGWSYNPSEWTQRLPIIALAVVGLIVARYLAGYQLGTLDGVWEPFFTGRADDPRNGTEEIITSHVSEAWPVSDGAVGAYTYMLEIVTGIVGSQRRWRTMPWLVLLFGLMIAPLGITSIFFVIIQPISIGTWSTLALIGAAAMLVQIPYSLDELLATLQFMRRRKRAGKSLLRVFLFGDTDEGKDEAPVDTLDAGPASVMRDMWLGGINLPWNLALSGLIGLGLLFSRLTIDADPDLANAHHLIGFLALTVISVAAAEVARPVRYLNALLGAVLIAVPYFYETDTAGLAVSVIGGLALIGLCLRRGPVREHYGAWNRVIA